MAEIRIQLGGPSADLAIGFSKVAPVYQKNGFKPIPVLGKRPLPKGATGYNGTVTPTKVAGWVKKYPDASVGLRVEGFVAVDVDHHDEKFGADQLRTLIESMGERPPTVSSTARGKESPSRQYFYRVDEDTPLNSDPSPDIEVVHKFHRFSVVAPSIHPVLLTPYVWYGPDGEEMLRLPTIEDFAKLPQGWVEGLCKKRAEFDHVGEFTGDIDDWIAWLGDVAPFRTVQNLRRDIEMSSHIGHQDLLRFLYRIHQTRLEGEASLAPAFHALVDQFRTTTNNPHWVKELEDAVRWVIGADWNPPLTNKMKDD